MKFVTFQHHHHAHAGVLQGEQVISLKEAGFYTLLEVIQGGQEARLRIASVLETNAPGNSFPLSSVKLLAPLPKPPKIICIGLNYRDHAIESKMEIPKTPTVFSKYASA